MPISKLLPRLQDILADPHLKWIHDPQLWAELFVTANLQFSPRTSTLRTR